MDWREFLPNDVDVQVSHIQDFLACASYSATHIAEMVLKKETGQFWEFSERALAKLSGTTHQGNSIQNVVNAINNYGLILASDWPVLTYSNNYGNVSWDEYYQNIPLPVLKKAFRFTASLKKLAHSEVPAALETAPIWTIIDAGATNHIVAQINQTQYYDSYEIRVKNFQASQPILSNWQLIIKEQTMTNAKLVNNKGEWGFFLPATGESSLIDKALNLGVPLPTTNNGANVDWPNVTADITIN